MKLIAPQFWQKKNVWSTLLRPFGWLYGKIVHLKRQLSHPQKVSIPVICVGNLTMGGSGKTPVALALAQILQNQQRFASREDIAFLTRGYGGKLCGPLVVNSSIHRAIDVGDEALILAQYHPTWVSHHRFKGAQCALQHGARVIIMDDGLQHLSLAQDLRFVVIDSTYGFGNTYVFPAGPLREELQEGLSHVDAVVIVGENHLPLSQQLPNDLPIFHVSFVPLEQPHSKRPVIAFAGIGHPQKFRLFLEKHGYNVLNFRAFPDHHPYCLKELDNLKKTAEQHNAYLITTEKDFLRLPIEFRSYVDVCRIEARFADLSAIEHFLKDKLHDLE